MITKIDRCSRNTLEFLKSSILFKKNITLVALDLPTSIDLAINKLIPTLYLALTSCRAQVLDQDLILEYLESVE